MTDQAGAVGTYPRIAVISGVDGHSDPWHALSETSAALADILGELGEVEVISTRDLTGAAAAELMVVNAGADLAAPPRNSGPVVDVIVAHQARGGAVLGMHSAALAFPDDPRWAEVLGGRWVPGRTVHPQIGHALVQASPIERSSGATPLSRDFIVYDERYCNLERHPGTTLVGHHTEDGLTHPLIWWRATEDGGPVAYDALGHGVESYEASGHREWLLAGAARLLAGARQRMEARP